MIQICFKYYSVALILSKYSKVVNVWLTICELKEEKKEDVRKTCDISDT